MKNEKWKMRKKQGAGSGGETSSRRAGQTPNTAPWLGGGLASPRSKVDGNRGRGVPPKLEKTNQNKPIQAKTSQITVKKFRAVGGAGQFRQCQGYGGTSKAGQISLTGESQQALADG